MNRNIYLNPVTEISLLCGERLMGSVVDSHVSGDPDKTPGSGFAPGRRIPL